MNNDKFKVLEYAKNKYNKFGFKSNINANAKPFGLIKDTSKSCQRIRNKKITKSQFPKLTKSSRIFNGGKRKKTKRKTNKKR